jgi:hypothetical protein
VRVDLAILPVNPVAVIGTDTEPDQPRPQAHAARGDRDGHAPVEGHRPAPRVPELVSRVVDDVFLQARDGGPYWEQAAAQAVVLPALAQTGPDVLRRGAEPPRPHPPVSFERSVLVVRAGGRAVTVVVAGQAVHVVEQRTGRVLASLPLDQVSAVIIEGANARPDLVGVVVAADEGPPGPGGLFAAAAVLVERLDELAPDGQETDEQGVTVNGAVVRPDETPRFRLAVIPIPPPPRGPAQRRGPAAEGETSSVVRQLFQEVREDLLRQARAILTEAQYAVFAQALERPRQGQGRSDREAEVA